MYLMDYWVLSDFIFMIFIHFRVKMKSFIYLHLKQRRAEEAVTAQHTDFPQTEHKPLHAPQITNIVLCHYTLLFHP